MSSNDHFQGNIVAKELKKFNRINEDIEDEINEKSEINPTIFLENYETELFEFDIPFSGQYNEGLEIINHNIDIIPSFPGKLTFNYLQNQIYISFIVDIDLPLNANNYPKFFAYIIFKKQKYDLYLFELKNRSIDFLRIGQRSERIRQQINSNQFDAQQFLNLIGNEKKIRMKLYVIKSNYDN